MPRIFAILSISLCALTALSAGPARGAESNSADLTFWQSIEHSSNPAEYQAYLDEFPDGRFAALARLRAKLPPRTIPAAPVPEGGVSNAEVAFWQAIDNARDPAEFRAYLDAYPHGRFAELARLRLASLGAGASAGAAAPANNAVTIETDGSSGPGLDLIEDVASLVGDSTALRVLPVLGQGSAQNLDDLARLRAIDLAIVQTDVLDRAREQGGPGSQITYIAKLYNEELHLLARRDVNSLADLVHQKVELGPPGSGTAITADRLFTLLKIAVLAAHDPVAAALQKLQKGEIAAVALVAPKPASAFRGLDGNRLHFLAIPITPAVTAAFIPTQLEAADYPGLVPPGHPIDTVAVGAVLAVAPLDPLSPRYQAAAAFVDRFFGGFETLLQPGHIPQWREVNLAAELPGGRRFAPAEEWLKRNASLSTMTPQALRAIFARFLEERQQAAGGPAVSEREKDDLFTQFERWQHGEVH
jgi:TRAP-type uncharacterized transport system substrate-binding protein